MSRMKTGSEGCFSLTRCQIAQFWQCLPSSLFHYSLAWFAVSAVFGTFDKVSRPNPSLNVQLYALFRWARSKSTRDLHELGCRRGIFFTLLYVTWGPPRSRHFLRSFAHCLAVLRFPFERASATRRRRSILLEKFVSKCTPDAFAPNIISNIEYVLSILSAWQCMCRRRTNRAGHDTT